MVIQSNMTPDAIIEVWEETKIVFKKYNVPRTKQTLESIVNKEDLPSLLKDLNTIVGSSTTTCVEGG